MQNTKLLTLAAKVLMLAAAAHAQVSMRGDYDFSGSRFRLPESTFASLPAASTVTGRVFIVTDGLTAGKCDAGGGTFATQCRSDGTVYAALGSSVDTRVDITQAPYYASGYAARAYSTSATVSGNAVVLVMNTVTGFTVGQYMHCLGIGSGGGSGTEFKGLITGISSLTITTTTNAGNSSSSGVVKNCWTEGATTGTASSSGTTVTVLSSATYRANQGVWLAGGGSSDDYRGTVVSITDATHIVVTPAVTTGVTAVLFQHDDSAAFQLAITNYAYTGAYYYVPGPEAGLYGVYSINGVVQDAGSFATHCNCVIRLPDVPAQSITAVTMFNFGSGQLPGDGSFPSTATIRTARTGGVALFGAYSSAAIIGKFSQSKLRFDHITFTTYSDPDLVVLDGTNMLGLHLDNVFVIGGGADHTQTHTASAGVRMPTTTNYVDTVLYNTTVTNFYTNIIAKEHTHMDRVYSSGAVVCYEMASASTAHPIYFGYLNAERCGTGMVGDSGSQVWGGVLSTESNTTDIAAGNFLSGSLSIQSSLAAAVMTGISFLRVHDIKANTDTGLAPLQYVGAATPYLQSTANTQFPSYTVKDLGGTSRAGFGYGETAVAAPFTDKTYWHSIGKGILMAISGAAMVEVKTTGVVQFNTVLTVSTLPTCNGAAEGTYSQVSDALTPAFLVTIVGGGSVHAPVFCNGTNWVAH